MLARLNLKFLVTSIHKADEHGDTQFRGEGWLENLLNWNDWHLDGI